MNIAGNRSQSDSPCVGICSATSLGDAVCIGCGRTAEQVRDWNKLTEADRVAINNSLALRAKELEVQS